MVHISWAISSNRAQFAFSPELTTYANMTLPCASTMQNPVSVLGSMPIALIAAFSPFRHNTKQNSMA
jgi:hypothetical protein